MGNLADSLGPLIVPPKRSDAQTPKRSNAPTPQRPGASTPRRPELPLQGTAISRHPDFTKKTLYVRSSTMLDAFRKYQDGGGKTESELVQMLLERYVGGVR